MKRIMLLLLVLTIFGCDKALDTGRVSWKQEEYNIKIERINKDGDLEYSFVTLSREEFDKLKIGDSYTRTGARP